MAKRAWVTENFSNKFVHFESEKELLINLEKCRNWWTHRQWLIANKVAFKHYPEEIEFQKFNKKYKLFHRAKMGRLNKAMEYAAKSKVDMEVI